MKQEFFVWVHTPRLPSLDDITSALAAADFLCRVQNQEGDTQDPRHWQSIDLRTEANGEPQNCTITVTIPTHEDIASLSEQYDDLPIQTKHAARKYTIIAEGDEYDQATLFQLRVVAAIAHLSHGVVEDPQESGLMLLEEFEDYIRDYIASA